MAHILKAALHQELAWWVGAALPDTTRALQCPPVCPPSWVLPVRDPVLTTRGPRADLFPACGYSLAAKEWEVTFRWYAHLTQMHTVCRPQLIADAVVSS